ncbi:ribonuclease P protein component [Naasia lichenicola]|uniref:Ribonuclease P protein component n=1 Tax=Naasia lichenicola TaxID=2565933 RepID=A0A4S4FI02_9MICO|nr:ribonuclease P protein component [Naasia lichenicola]THG29464.1 ribonuclease P protein component [Naasia lichenicola]
MLHRANRIVTGADYRRVVRRGRRSAGQLTIVHVQKADADAPARFGFIVSRAVGGAVQRNRVRRRLKAISHGILTDGLAGVDVVIRALPASAQADWSSLSGEVEQAMHRSRP